MGRKRFRDVRTVVLLAGLLLLLSACGSSDALTASADEEASADAESMGEAGEAFEQDEAQETDDAAVEDGPVAAGASDVEPTESGADVNLADTVTADEGPPSDGDSSGGEAAGDETASGETAEEEEGLPEEGGEPPEETDQLGAGGAAVTPTAADIGRKLIFTAALNVEVDDVAAASANATSIIEGMGGFLFGQNTTGGAEPSSELTFKVLPSDFNIALERLGTVGELRNQTVTTDDVTERIVDLESRIGVAQLGVERLRAELESTSSLDDFAEVERLLLERESELEVMRGQLRTLQDRVDLATITLVVSQDRVENAIQLTISSYEGHDGGQGCPGESGSSTEAGTPVTVCFDILNVGDQTLTDVVLLDTVLDIGPETQLIPVFGDLAELAPGQSAVVGFEFEPERRQQLRTRVTAVPTDGVSADPAGPTVTTQVNFDVQAFEAESDPGFRDGFSVAVELLQGLWVLVKVLAGFSLLPVLIFGPLLWLSIRSLRSWRRNRPARPTPSQPVRQPPPPQPVAAASVTGESGANPPVADGDDGASVES